MTDYMPSALLMRLRSANSTPGRCFCCHSQSFHILTRMVRRSVVRHRPCSVLSPGTLGGGPRDGRGSRVRAMVRDAHRVPQPRRRKIGQAFVRRHARGRLDEPTSAARRTVPWSRTTTKPCPWPTSSPTGPSPPRPRSGGIDAAALSVNVEIRTAAGRLRPRRPSSTPWCDWWRTMSDRVLVSCFHCRRPICPVRRPSIPTAVLHGPVEAPGTGRPRCARHRALHPWT